MNIELWAVVTGVIGCLLGAAEFYQSWHDVDEAEDDPRELQYAGRVHRMYAGVILAVQACLLLFGWIVVSWRAEHGGTPLTPAITGSLSRIVASTAFAWMSFHGRFSRWKIRYRRD